MNLKEEDSILGDKFGFLEANIEMGLLIYGEKLKEYISNLLY